MTRVLTVKDLSFAYAGGSVLEEVTFQVQRGECFIIIGPNGSGKTTLIRSLAGLLSPKSGEIDVQGRPLKTYSRRELALQLAYVSQTGGEESPFTILEMALMGRSPYLGLLGVEGERDIAIARQAIEVTGLRRLAHRRMDKVSGGERQRAHIARAICQQTDLLLLDEPTAALDLAHQVRVMELMVMLKKERGTTVVMVSHDLNLAAMYADRLLLLVDGRQVICGSPQTVMQEEILASAYGCSVLVDRSPVGNWPRINLVKKRLDGRAAPGGQQASSAAHSRQTL